MEGFFTIVTVGAFFLGMIFGGNNVGNAMRDKVVVYCIEKPQLCKDEYTNIKTQNKLNNYQRPEIEELK